MGVLTNREMQIAELLAWGASDRSISEELYISFDTVRTHHRNIYKKLGLKNLSDLTRWYFQSQAKVCFGVKPKTRIALLLSFLFLTVAVEFFHINTIRVRTVRVRPIKTARKSSRKSETYYL